MFLRTFKALSLLFTIGAIFLFAKPASADGLVPMQQGYTYSVGGCPQMDSNMAHEGVGTSPAAAFGSACFSFTKSVTFNGCLGIMSQSYGGLAGMLQDWQQFNGTVDVAVFAYSFARTFYYPDDPVMGECSLYNSSVTGSDQGVAIYRTLGNACPANSDPANVPNMCLCRVGYASDVIPGACTTYFSVVHDKPEPYCTLVGDPISPLTGANSLDIEIGNWFGEPAYVSYQSRSQLPSGTTHTAYIGDPAPSLGALWQESYHKRIDAQYNPNPNLPSPAPIVSVQVSREAGVWVSFAKTGSGYVADADISDQLVDLPTGGWAYKDLKRGAIETYDINGYLRSIAHLDGTSLVFTYSGSSTPQTVAPSTGLLIQITDQFGRQVGFTYGASTTITSATDPSGGVSQFSYDGNANLTQITWPDGANKQFLYENTTFPWALTGVLDENGTRINSYGYDAAGRANDTQAAGGVNHYALAYSTPPSWVVADSIDANGLAWRDFSWAPPQGVTVTDPNGQTRNVAAANVVGMPHISSQSQPAGSGCSASSSNIAYDANGNKAWQEDFNGHRSCYASDLARNLETARVEGLASGTDCTSPLAAGSALPSGARKISTQWHPVWKREVQEAQPGLLTTWVYNGQPDPTAGGALASCAPTSATLSDGSPIVVLCKQIEQATTDASGAQGLAASLNTSVPTRTQSWTYNAYGQVLTATDPLSHTTSYSYYTDTTAAHTMGDLQSVTNPLSQATQFTQYNPAGKVLTSVDPNGITTTFTYDLRQRLTGVSTAGLNTSYAYDPSGQLVMLTLPDGSAVHYGYDPAHRLVQITDGAGNTVVYTLDASGNRTGEQLSDPNGALTRTITRTYDALNRLQTVVGAPQ